MWRRSYRMHTADCKRNYRIQKSGNVEPQNACSWCKRNYRIQKSGNVEPQNACSWCKRNYRDKKPCGVEATECMQLVSGETKQLWYIHLTAIGLKPGGSNTAHIYIQTVHRRWVKKRKTFLFHVPAVLVTCWHSARHAGKLTTATNVRNESKCPYIHLYMLVERRGRMRSEVRNRMQCTSNYNHLHFEPLTLQGTATFSPKHIPWDITAMFDTLSLNSL
jgi:hypothetical protein